MPKNNGSNRKAQRQGIAQANQSARESRTNDEQALLLNDRPGLALKERTRLGFTIYTSEV